MIGLEAHRPGLTDYRECINTIETAVKKFTAEELEEMNARERQAGVTVLKWEDFQKTDHVSVLPVICFTVPNCCPNFLLTCLLRGVHSLPFPLGRLRPSKPILHQLPSVLAALPPTPHGL